MYSAQSLAGVSMRHVISILVENHFGVLARVSSLFSARGYNIDSLCVGETEDSTVSRMTVVVRGDERILDQIEKQLKKLVEVVEVFDLTKDDHVERELVLIKIAANGRTRTEVIEVANIFRAKICDMGNDALIVEVTGSSGKVNACIDMMRPFGIKELVRTGAIAIARSPKPTA